MDRRARESLAPTSCASWSVAFARFVNLRLAPVRIEPSRWALPSSLDSRFAPSRFALHRCAPGRCAPRRSGIARGFSCLQVFHASTPFFRIARCPGSTFTERFYDNVFMLGSLRVARSGVFSALNVLLAPICLMNGQGFIAVLSMKPAGNGKSAAGPSPHDLAHLPDRMYTFGQSRHAIGTLRNAILLICQELER